MDFGPAQVFAQDGLRHETSFGSEWVQFELRFRPGRVLARGRFWIGKWSVRLRPTWVYARYGFQSATGFGPTRVSARDRFFCFASNRFRSFQLSCFVLVRFSFDSLFRFGLDLFFRFRFGSVSTFSAFFVSVWFGFGFILIFCVV
ncbi:hypothetical protein Hanom_Chr04g00352251 [Helianthus anomalus]